MAALRANSQLPSFFMRFLHRVEKKRVHITKI